MLFSYHAQHLALQGIWRGRKQFDEAVILTHILLASRLDPKPQLDIYEKARGGDDLAGFFVETNHRIGRWSSFHLSTLKAVDDLQYCQNRSRYRQYKQCYFKTQKSLLSVPARVGLSLDEGDPASLLTAAGHPVLAGALFISKFVATPVKVAVRKGKINDEFYAKLSVDH